MPELRLRRAPRPAEMIPLDHEVALLEAERELESIIEFRQLRHAELPQRLDQVVRRQRQKQTTVHGAVAWESLPFTDIDVRRYAPHAGGNGRDDDMRAHGIGFLARDQNYRSRPVGRWKARPPDLAALQRGASGHSSWSCGMSFNPARTMVRSSGVTGSSSYERTYAAISASRFSRRRRSPMASCSHALRSLPRRFRERSISLKIASGMLIASFFAILSV